MCYEYVFEISANISKHLPEQLHLMSIYLNFAVPLATTTTIVAKSGNNCQGRDERHEREGSKTGMVFQFSGSKTGSEGENSPEASEGDSPHMSDFSRSYFEGNFF